MPPALTTLDPKTILVRSTNWIGDAVMTLPALATIRHNFPAARISILVKPWVADVFAASTFVDEIILYHKGDVHGGLAGLWRLGRELRTRRFDAAILLQNAFEAALIARLAAIPVVAGYVRDVRRVLLTHPVALPTGRSCAIPGTSDTSSIRSVESKERHQVHYYQELMAGLGLVKGDDWPCLTLPAAASSWAQNYVQPLAGPVIGLNPGAAYGPAKKWPAERYGEVAARLAAATGGTVLIFGTAADRETVRTIQVQAPRALDLTGKTTLAEAMALIGQCRLFLTNDSGLMHVAAALATPLVAIFGSTDRVATGPFSPSAVVIQKELPCIPCLKTDCTTGFRCMLDIGVDEVYEAAAALLGKLENA